MSCTPTKATPTDAQTAALASAAPSAAPSVVASAAPSGVASAVASAVSSASITNDAAVTLANGVVAADEKGADGWLVGDRGHGIRRVPRAEAIARIKAEKTRVVVQPTFAFDECRNGLSTHAYFEVPASAGAKPFGAAVITGEVLPWRNLGANNGELYVAGVRVGTLQTPQVASCDGAMPPHDATVVALVPVRSVAEGRRLLERMP